MNPRIGSVALAVVILLAPIAQAKDTGFYLGGSVGSASIQQEGSDPDLGNFELDESEFAYKVFGGYQFGAVFGVEGGYVDLGSPSNDLLSTDLDGWTIAALAGLPLGPFRVFGKAGGFYWDAKSELNDEVDLDDDGFDFTAGAGVEIELGSFGIRGEVEYLDILDDTWLYSVGATITF